MDFPRGKFKESFSLFLTCPDEIINIVNNMIKKSASYDNISIDIMKLAIQFIAEPLSLLINQSFSDGNVHDFLKIASLCCI